ncbi:hypothetical protein CPB85DRAFT_1432525 [Mucidula mucida]|nr:hypothetical protein CPB85DRAFT_1432525 [Mucidula mucida]
MSTWSWASIPLILDTSGVLGHSNEIYGDIFSRSDTPSVKSYDTGQSFQDVSSEMSRAGAIVGGVLGGVSALLLTFALCVFYHRHRIARHPEEGNFVASTDEKSQSRSFVYNILHRDLAILPKSSVPSSRMASHSSEKQDSSSLLKGFQRSEIIVDISRPKPAVQSPPFPFGASKRSPDLPFLVVPPTGNSTRNEPYILPATAQDRGGRRKIQIPPQAVVITPIVDEPKVRRAQQPSQALKDLATAAWERWQQLRVAKQVAFAGIETIDAAGPSRSKSSSSTRSTASFVRAQMMRREIDELRKEVKLLSKYVSSSELSGFSSDSSPPPLYSNAI